MDKAQAVKAFAVLAKMQDDMNSVVDTCWREANYPFYRALWTELGEASNYILWPWWRNAGNKTFANAGDTVQFYLELADALHFGISMNLMAFSALGQKESNEGDHLRVAEGLYEGLRHAIDRIVPRNMTLMGMVEVAARDALTGNGFNAAYLFAAAFESGLGQTGLILYYHGKNLLNVFRQENGYKTGGYIKNWGTQESPAEDNVELANIIEQYRSVWTDQRLLQQIDNGDFARHVKRRLAEAYSDVRERQNAG